MIDFMHLKPTHEESVGDIISINDNQETDLPDLSEFDSAFPVV